MRTISFLLSLTALLSVGQEVHPAPIPLQQPTATYSQQFSGSYSVQFAIDGDTNQSGWAVQRGDGFGYAETAVFEAAQDVGFPSGTELTFRLKTHFPTAEGNHNLGRFRLSVTTGSREQFADGLDEEGDVDAEWIVLEPERFSAAAGAVLTKLPDQSLLASGPNAATETYTVVARTAVSGVTGFRLEAIPDPSLPHGGPGRAANGNFVLVDFSISAEPVRTPATIRCSAVDICWEGLAGKLYQVQYESALTGRLWVNLGDPIPGPGLTCVTDRIVDKEERFYRVIPLP